MEIVVIGGGVGGLTAALALAQGGNRVQVLERAARFAQPGAGLRLAPNATGVLDRLGLLDQVLELASQPRQAVLRDLGSGADLAHLNLGAPLTARYGTPYLVAGRANLLSLLADACADADVELRSGREVTEVEVAHSVVSGTGGAVISCADGRTYTADMILAADGAQSAARTLLLPGGGQSDGDGWAAYRATVSADELADSGLLGREGGDEVIAWTGPDAHFALYPVAAAEAYEQVAVFRSHLYPLTCPYPRASGYAGIDVAARPDWDGLRPDWGGPEELDEAFSWAAEPVRAAVRRLRRDRCWRLLDQGPLRDWAADRVALLGDAMHPMPGFLAQGACQAIEDAGVLADAIADCPGPRYVADALAAYQARRAPRATRVSRVRQVWESGPRRHQRADDYADSDWLYAPAG
jgi:salicylate hydroxylase